MAEEPVKPPGRLLLAPLLLLVLVALTFFAGLRWAASRAHTTVVVVIRHAETLENAIPAGLSEQGFGRAEALGGYLARLLGERPVDHIYAAQGRPAQQTATSIANEYKLPINLLAPSDWQDMPDRIRRQHRGEYLVVIGELNGIPALVRELTGTEVTLEPNAYGEVFLVVLADPGENRLFQLEYGISDPNPD